MKTIKVLLTVAMFVGLVDFCQGQDDLQVKLAKLEAVSKVQKSTTTTLQEKVTCKKKSLADRIDKLKAAQKDVRQVCGKMDSRISTLERKLVDLEAKANRQNIAEALAARLSKLEANVRQLQEQPESVQVASELCGRPTVDGAGSGLAEINNEPSELAEAEEENSKLEETKVKPTADISRNTTELEPATLKTEVEPTAPAAEPITVNLLDTTAVEVEDDRIGFDFSVDYFGKYIWRGQNVTDDPVIQPTANMTYGNLTASLWGNLDTTKINNNSGEFIEYDWSLDYTDDLPFWDGVSYSLGLIYYYFPSADASDTTELYAGLSFDLPLSPSVTVYNDIDEVNGTYVLGSIGHSFEKIGELAPGIPVGMDIGASLGWGSASYNKAYWGSSVKSGKLNDLVLSVSFPFEVGGWSVSPSLNYVTLVNGTIRESDAFRQESDYFFAGISIGKSF